jgi:hypothetical protein
LFERLEDKKKRGHVLDRLTLTACKWLLIIEGVPIDRAQAKVDRELNKPAKPADIKLPQLLKKLQ